MKHSWFTEALRVFQHARLRTQILLVINTLLVLVMALPLSVDYSYEVRSRLNEKEISLREEARVIEAAVESLQSSGWDSIQTYINRVCAGVNAAESPGHTIEVKKGDRVVITDPASHGHFHLMPWSKLVVGGIESAELSVRVGEHRAPIMADARKVALIRSFGLASVAILTAVLLNFLLIRLVTKPIERLSQDVQRIGRGELGLAVKVSRNREFDELGRAITKMSKDLAEREADRHSQLKHARRLQSHLLPSASAMPELAIDVSIMYQPADEIAGDFVDVISCSNGDTVLCIADVVGHGIHAAMGAAVLKALVLASDPDHLSPAELLDIVNRRFCEISLPEDFASMAVMRVNRDQSEALYASAGHEPGLIRRASGVVEPAPSTGLVLGIDPETIYDQAEYQLGIGDRVVMLSDGVSEATDEAHKLFGRSRLSSVIENTTGDDADALARSILEAVTRHRSGAPALDDTSVLVFAAQPTRKDNPVCTSIASA